MEIPITNPHLSAEMTDNSKTDESITTSGTTVNVGPGGVIQQHCGNQKGEREFTRIMSTFLILLISLICDAFLGLIIWQGQSNTMSKLDAFGKITHENQEKLQKQYQEFTEKSSETHRDMMKQAKEGTIWLLRDDIIKTIDYHEAKKSITPKQYKRLRDEFDYYTEIGGNHDVKERFDDFTAKIYGTQEVKMVNEIQMIGQGGK